MSNNFVNSYFFVDGMMRGARVVEQEVANQKLRTELEVQRVRNSIPQNTYQAVGPSNAISQEMFDEMAEKLKYYQKREAQLVQEKNDLQSTFMEKYKGQEEIMANWMISQKAAKEIAMDLGVKEGIKPEEIHKQILDKKEDILNNDSKYGNLVDMTDELRDKLKAKLVK